MNQTRKLRCWFSILRIVNNRKRGTGAACGEKREQTQTNLRSKTQHLHIDWKKITAGKPSFPCVIYSQQPVVQLCYGISPQENCSKSRSNTIAFPFPFPFPAICPPPTPVQTHPHSQSSYSEEKCWLTAQRQACLAAWVLKRSTGHRHKPSEPAPGHFNPDLLHHWTAFTRANQRAFFIADARYQGCLDGC